MISPSTSTIWSNVRPQGWRATDKRFAQGLEPGHVAANERAPDSSVHARQALGQKVVAEQHLIRVEQAIENERLRPFLQT